MKVKEQSDILEHVQNNLMARNKVDRIIPVRNIIDHKYKDNFYYTTKFQMHKKAEHRFFNAKQDQNAFDNSEIKIMK